LSVTAGFRLQPVFEAAQRHLEVATTELQKLAARRREADAKLHQLRFVGGTAHRWQKLARALSRTACAISVRFSTSSSAQSRCRVRTRCVAGKLGKRHIGVGSTCVRARKRYVY
jgi:hypothetical protein